MASTTSYKNNATSWLKNELLLASHNAGKLKDFQALLAPLSCTLRSADAVGVGDIPETGHTFLENALLKARTITDHTGQPALGEDSGLCVDALQGRPGLYTARYAGPDRDFEDACVRLIKEVDDSKQPRHAQFVACIVLTRFVNDPDPLMCLAHWHGHIANEPKGQQGFGFDPIFIASEHNPTQQTNAELGDEFRNQFSHRALAVKQLLAQLLHDH